MSQIDTVWCASPHVGDVLIWQGWIVSTSPTDPRAKVITTDLARITAYASSGLAVQTPVRNGGDDLPHRHCFQSAVLQRGDIWDGHKFSLCKLEVQLDTGSYTDTHIVDSFQQADLRGMFDLHCAHPDESRDARIAAGPGPRSTGAAHLEAVVQHGSRPTGGRQPSAPPLIRSRSAHARGRAARQLDFDTV